MARSLRDRIVETTERALRSGALQPIPTESEYVDHGGIRFLVRIVSNLARKTKARKQPTHTPDLRADKPENPFLPHDPELFVADVSDTHVGLLNKFNVVEHHLLIVTRAFEHQETLLTLSDFEAMWRCMAEIDGLAFYNGGVIAGASQPHKHLQMVPLPLAPDGAKVPIDPLIAAAQFRGEICEVPSFPFLHAVAGLEPGLRRSHPEAAAQSLDLYRKLLCAVGLPIDTTTPCPRQSGPYNLLVTREWMLLVPRSREFFRTVSVNALGFAGSLFVRNHDEMKAVKQCGPMVILQKTGLPSRRT